MTSATSNVVWCEDEDVHTKLRSSGAGRAVVGGGEEVLCWDVKKGELLSRWHEDGCTAEVTVIARSKTDPDFYAVG